ncbi:hypothetical protein HRI_000648900 [Hibiscus trionum]|uniref:Endonuclease/exonuclease/phosphatase domain-containing protein n=1 Tax=Hibiscus trionum TaxID=183268 RepID=A0A9W7H3A2_HIBTR|nr:hypothetical protein HRI_000648900 [Hibiscus trionum]
MNFSFLTWNIRGLGKVEKVRAIQQLVNASKARVVFIQESKLETLKPWVQRRIKTVPSIGSSGGLISVWDSFFGVEGIVTHSRWIAINGAFVLSTLKPVLLNVYAPNEFSDRREVLIQLTEFIESLEVPVIIWEI